MAFVLLYVSIMLIVISETSIDCIQNFVGLYILLDLDVTIMHILRTTRFTALLIYIKRLSMKSLKEELEGKKVFVLGDMKQLFNESEMELDLVEEKKNNPYVKKVVLGLRMLAIFFLMIVMLLAWISIYIEVINCNFSLKINMFFLILNNKFWVFSFRKFASDRNL